LAQEPLWLKFPKKKEACLLQRSTDSTRVIKLAQAFQS